MGILNRIHEAKIKNELKRKWEASRSAEERNQALVELFLIYGIISNIANSVFEFHIIQKPVKFQIRKFVKRFFQTVLLKRRQINRDVF